MAELSEPLGQSTKESSGTRANVLLVDDNVLWDCVPLLDPALIEKAKALGGIAAIAISHPHYYTSMVKWSRAFSDVPIYLHAADRQWVMRPDKAISFWDGETKAVGDGLTLVRCGGHFEGGTVLHWQGGANEKGALLTGDIIQVVADRQHVSFMYSYPNYVPLSAAGVERIVQAVAPFEYDRVYGAFWDTVIEQDGKSAVDGNDEMEPAQGRGWAIIKSDDLHGMIFFHQGDDSEFVATKTKVTKRPKRTS